jgi:hypothetical protein
MQRLVLGLIVSLSVAGCAPGNDFSPSLLGAGDLIDEANADEYGREHGPDTAMRYVTSNKVLGAMAFQKATGRSVDPERLSGR